MRSSVDGEAVRNSSSNMAQGAQNAASNFFSSMANAVKIPSATVSIFQVTNTVLNTRHMGLIEVKICRTYSKTDTVDFE